MVLVPGHGFGGGPTGERHLELALKTANGLTIGTGAEGGGDATSARATGAANAMDEVFGGHRQIEVDDVGDAFDVDAAGGDVGGDEHAVGALFEAVKGLIALSLRTVTMDARGFDAHAAQVLLQFVDAVLGAGEYQEAAGLVLQHILQQRQLAFLIDLVDMQVHFVGRMRVRAGFDAKRLAKVLLNEAFGRLLDGSREEKRLPVRRHAGENAFDGRQETHVEHAVAFVQHQQAHGVQLNQIAVKEVTEATGRGDDDLCALADVIQLSVLIEAADDGGGAEAGTTRQFDESLLNLDRQFAGGAEDQRLHAGLLLGLQQRLQHGQQERKRFAGAGLCRGDDVFARKSRRHRKGLYLSGGGNVLPDQIGQQCRGNR